MDAATRSQPRMPERRRWTVEEYLNLGSLDVFGDEHVELLDGDIVTKMSSVGAEHGMVVSQMAEWLFRVKPPTMGLYIQQTTLMPGANAPEPDIALLRRPVAARKGYPTADEVLWAIEVADSSLALDRGRKGLLYGAAGIPEYWIVNLRDRLLEVHREPTADGYAFVKRYSDEETVRPLAIDAAITVSALLPPI